MYAYMAGPHEAFLKFTEDTAKRENLVEDIDKFRLKWRSKVKTQIQERSAVFKLSFAVVMRVWDWGPATHTEELSLSQLWYTVVKDRWRAHSNGTHVYEDGAWGPSSTIDYATAKDVQNICGLACAMLMAAMYDKNAWPEGRKPKPQDFADWINKTVDRGGKPVATNAPQARYALNDRTVLRFRSFHPQTGGEATIWDKKAQSLVNAAMRMQKTETGRVCSKNCSSGGSRSRRLTLPS